MLCDAAAGAVTTSQPAAAVLVKRGAPLTSKTLRFGPVTAGLCVRALHSSIMRHRLLKKVTRRKNQTRNVHRNAHNAQQYECKDYERKQLVTEQMKSLCREKLNLLNDVRGG